MKIRFGETTRGSGKVYVHVVAEGAPEGCTMEVDAVTRDGAALPARCLTVEGVPGWVVVLPLLGVSQRVIVSLFDTDGTLLAGAAKVVNPLVANVSSKVNTLRHNEVALAIRNCDEHQRGGGIDVRMDKLICGENGEPDYLRGTVTLTSSSREDVDAEFTLDFLGPDGHPANASSWTNMGDSTKESADYPGTWVRTVGFSVRIPQNVRALTLWARSPLTPLADGFRSVEDFEMRDERKDWRKSTMSADAADTYEKWFLTKHRASQQALDVQRVHGFELEPTFSIVVPLFKTPLPFLHDMVRSVLGQTYPHLELVLVNASPEDVALSQAVEDYAHADERVRVVRLAENLGITLNTQAGIDAATGDFVAFLDHDDVVEPDILYCYAKAVNEHPDTDLIYCDEDKLLDGHYVNPYFKCDWNVDLIRSNNYVCHMLTVRRELLLQMPPSEGAFDGAQDHHMTLWVSERARHIHHVPRVLYHWRIHGQSTAGAAAAKDYTTDAGIRAIQAHLDRLGLDAVAEPSPAAPNNYHVRYAVHGEPSVSIVIPNKDLGPVLERCIDSILEKSTYQNYEILIVENNSTEPATFELYDRLQARDQRVRVVTYDAGGKFSFPKVINFGVEQSTGEYILMLNNDMELLTPDWLELMLGLCQREDVGIVGAKLLYPDGLIQHAGVAFHKAGPCHIGLCRPANTHVYYEQMQLLRDYTAVTGACLMVSRADFLAVGGMDETFAVDYNDIDFCMRIRERDLLVVYEPTVQLMHYESISRGKHTSESSAIRWAYEQGLMMSRYPRYWAIGDPYMNPYLSDNGYHLLDIWTEA